MSIKPWSIKILLTFTSFVGRVNVDLVVLSTNKLLSCSPAGVCFQPLTGRVIA